MSWMTKICVLVALAGISLSFVDTAEAGCRRGRCGMRRVRVFHRVQVSHVEHGGSCHSSGCQTGSCQ